MKDYPDAQEILQTLGRKRLMEVRCVNKKHLKAQSDKEALRLQNSHPHTHPHPHPHVSDNSSENSASKKIVDKMMGIKSVLKKTRTSRRSNESLEMQPLHSSTSPKILPKGMLKRMSRVKSDDDKRPFDTDLDNTHHLHSSSAGAIAHVEIKDKTPSPIGAGLPLLQRLRLLKEKQVRDFLSLIFL